MQQYIHYGATEFISERFAPILNRPYFTKPEGGLWASPVNAGHGWRDWCKNSCFRLCEEENSFRFFLSHAANLLDIRAVEQLRELPKAHNEIFEQTGWGLEWDCLDFEQLLSEGIDAIQANISEDRRLYWRLYGWDCDSILIMNKDIIAPLDDLIDARD